MHEFIVTDQHIKLARRMFTSWDDCEFGAPSINPKRPYGNSDVIGDMIEILKIPMPAGYEQGDDYPDQIEQQMIKLHKSMEIALQIFLCTGEFKPGTYRQTEEYNSLSWRLKP